MVIGINNYQKWPKLEFALADARSMAAMLKQRGFDEITMLLDGEATQQKILGMLGDELAKRTQPNDRVVIFFAGHGQTEDLANGGKMGYIIPFEGELDNYYSTAISMSQLQQLSDRLRAKHILYVMDACFSGLLLRLRGDGPEVSNFSTQTTVPARQVLTAGGEGERAMEMEGHGIFTRMLLEGLQDTAADANGDGHITASELYKFVTSRVSGASRNTQNPSFGRLGIGHGEFNF